MLVVLSGIHGSEYVPIRATQKLGTQLKPDDLRKGTLVLVHIANLPQYLGRTVYTGPDDHKNLNRVFPGNPRGTASERLADFLVTHIYSKADFMMDIHSGDANEQLGPSYTAYYGRAGSPTLIETSREMALAFGLDLVVEFQWELELPAGTTTNNTSTSNSTTSATSSGDDHAYKGAIWAGSAAVVRGIPSIDVEVAPGMGRNPPENVEEVVRGIRNVMGHLGMTASVAKDQDNQPNDPCLVTDRSFLESPAEGTWIPAVDTATLVREGDLLGHILDLVGHNILWEARAPHDGLLLIRLETPPIIKGDPVAVVAELPASSGCRVLEQKLLRGNSNSNSNNRKKSLFLWHVSAAAGWMVALGLGGVLLWNRRRNRRTRGSYEPAESSAAPNGEGTMA